jgi:hypothetical protein
VSRTGSLILAAGLGLVVASLPAIYFAVGLYRGLMVLVCVLSLEAALCLLMLVARVKIKAVQEEKHRASTIIAALRNGTINPL